MLDLAFVRANLELVEEKLRARGLDPAALLGDFRALDRSRREAITTAEQLKARHNESPNQYAMGLRAQKPTAKQLSEMPEWQKVATLNDKSQDFSKSPEGLRLLEETRALKEMLDQLDRTASTLDEQLHLALSRIPNLTRDEVPTGNSETDNLTEKTWGKIPQFTFAPKPHWELGEALGILDLERAAKLSGARFAVYMGAGARLERALISFMLDLHTAQHGYTEVLPPFMVNSKVPLRHRPVAQVRRRPLPLFRRRRRSRQPAASSKTPTTGSSPPPKSPSPTSIATKSSTNPACPSRSPLIRPASAPKPEPPARIPAASSASTSSKKSSWSSSPAPRTPKPSTSASPATPKRSLKPSACPTAAFCSAPPIPASPPPRLTTSKSGSPASSLYREISSCSNFEAFQARRANIRYRPSGQSSQGPAGICPHPQRQRPGRRPHLARHP